MPNNPPKGNPVRRDVLRKLYWDEKKSLADIALALDISVHKVTYWMWKYRIPTRSISEAVYLKHNPDGEPYSIRTDLSLGEEKLKSLAIGLYWGEGNKASTHAVRVTNSDPGVINVFFKFLLEICMVDKKKVGYYLQTFKDINIEAAKLFWAENLGVEPDQIHTGRPIPSMGKGSYKKISRHGVMTVAFFNTHLKAWFMNELEKLGSK